MADVFDVYLFPHDIPVNLASPLDLDRLREVFAGRELYLAVGSDVVANASSYRASPSPGSVHHLNHIVFRRSSDAEGHEIDADLSRIQEDVIELQLPTHLEDISSTRILPGLYTVPGGSYDLEQLLLTEADYSGQLSGLYLCKNAGRAPLDAAARCPAGNTAAGPPGRGLCLVGYQRQSAASGFSDAADRERWRPLRCLGG